MGAICLSNRCNRVCSSTRPELTTKISKSVREKRVLQARFPYRRWDWLRRRSCSIYRVMFICRSEWLSRWDDWIAANMELGGWLKRWFQQKWILSRKKHRKLLFDTLQTSTAQRKNKLIKKRTRLYLLTKSFLLFFYRYRNDEFLYAFFLVLMIFVYL